MKRPEFFSLLIAVIVVVNAPGTLGGEELTEVVIRIDNPVPSSDAFFGQSVAGIDDVDGDGVRDLAVGAPGADKVYLFSGSDQSLIRVLHDPAGLTGFDFGFAAVGVGDVDGDGVEDLAVGAPSAFTMVVPLPPPTPDWGRAFILSGATGATLYELHPGVSSRGFPDDFFQFGFSVAALGDVTGDGIPDIAVSAPVLNIRNWGEVYAFSGADGSQIWVTGEPGFPSVKQTVPSFGYLIKEVEDVTGDSLDDLLVGAPYHDVDADPDVNLLAGESYILSGADGSIFRIYPNPSPVSGAVFGLGLEGIGDQNGDGVEDHAVGESGVSTLHLFQGLDGSSFGVIGNPSGGGLDYFGRSVAGVDNRDADGFDDFWVGSPKDGAAYLLNSLGDLIAQVDDPVPLPVEDVRGFGFAISPVGDLDGNGILDVIVGKPAETVAGYEGAGAAFVIFLNRPPTADPGGPYSAECAGVTTTVGLDGSGSSDPDIGDALTFLWGTDCPGGSYDDPTGEFPVLTMDTSPGCAVSCNVSLTVVDDGGGEDSAATTVTIDDSIVPVLSEVPESGAVSCEAVQEPAGVSATDSCDPSPIVSFSEVRADGSCPYEYALTRTWSATDECGNAVSSEQVLEVSDVIPPGIVCNAPATISPPDAPISFTAKATDNCDDSLIAEVVGFDCFKFNKSGKRIDKTESCVVNVLGGTLTILDSGGVGDIITWTVHATDSCGNETAVECGVEVVNPAR